MKEQIHDLIKDAAQKVFPNASPDQIEQMTQDTSGKIAGIVACFHPDIALESPQRRVLELTALIPGYKSHSAQRTEIENKITCIKHQMGYQEPVMISVRNVSGHDVQAGEKKIKPSEVDQVYPWEWRSLARFLEIQP
jgi:hypothetical protein